MLYVIPLSDYFEIPQCMPEITNRDVNHTEVKKACRTKVMVYDTTVFSRVYTSSNHMHGHHGQWHGQCGRQPPLGQ